MHETHYSCMHELLCFNKHKLNEAYTLYVMMLIIASVLMYGFIKQ